jgi:predicted ATP-grasp superfamily ATP-dependent carboligase
MKKYKVLIFPGGTEIGLEIHRALCQCKEVILYSAGLDVSNHAPFVFARHYTVPSVDDPAWLDSLNQVIIEHEIDFVFPAHDDVIIALAQSAEEVKAKILCSPLATCIVCRSKSETYRLLGEVVPVPTIYPNPDAIEKYPVFAKPDKGQGSRHTHIVHTMEFLLHLLAENRQYVVTEYLPGEEYTVDCFSDRDKGLLFCSGRQRIRTRNGISMNSKSVHDSVFEKCAEAISQVLTFHGAWFFQLKRDFNDIYKLLEVAPRIAGSMAVHRVQGINFALLNIYEMERIPYEIMHNRLNVQIDRALVNRYSHTLKYNTVYVDLDDTLIINDKINSSLIAFLYQCINKGKKIILLTKHVDDVHTTLRRYRLVGIFDEVIKIKSGSTKSDYIHDRNAIFIDDSFSERKAVNKKKGILSFDCSMIEMLLDERV